MPNLLMILYSFWDSYYLSSGWIGLDDTCAVNVLTPSPITVTEWSSGYEAAYMTERIQDFPT
jgi:hypothetical protein